MTNETFVFHWRRLCGAFSATKPDEKGKIYFEELEKYDGSTFAKICAQIIRQDDRFPSIAKIITLIDSITPKEKTGIENCAVCNGSGWVWIWGVVYRGRCKHGEKLSTKISIAPLDENGIAEERSKQKQQQKQFCGLVREPLAIPAIKSSQYWH